MATRITEDCINCGACEDECPNGAISMGEEIFVIEPALCTECVGFSKEQLCAVACPPDVCVADLERVESRRRVLFERAQGVSTPTTLCIHGSLRASARRISELHHPPSGAGTARPSNLQQITRREDRSYERLRCCHCRRRAQRADRRCRATALRAQGARVWRRPTGPAGRRRPRNSSRDSSIASGAWALLIFREEMIKYLELDQQGFELIRPESSFTVFGDEG